MSDCIRDVYATILDRRDNPSENSYTRYLFDQGIDKILKKVGEECAETLIAAKNGRNDETAGGNLRSHLPRAGADGPSGHHAGGSGIHSQRTPRQGGQPENLQKGGSQQLR